MYFLVHELFAFLNERKSYSVYEVGNTFAIKSTPYSLFEPRMHTPLVSVLDWNSSGRHRGRLGFDRCGRGSVKFFVRFGGMTYRGNLNTLEDMLSAPGKSIPVLKPQQWSDPRGVG